MRIAKPLLLIMTPIGVAGGIYEAFHLTGGLAFLMIAMVLLISVATGGLVLTIRKEQKQLQSASSRSESSDRSDRGPVP